MNRLDKGLLVRVDREYNRVWITGWRLHHGAVGAFLIGFGLVLAAHDWADRHLWMKGRDD